MKLGRFFSVIMATALLLAACGQSHSTTSDSTIACASSKATTSDSQSVPTDERGRDFYEVLADGADNCNDLTWLLENCHEAPYGVFGNGGPGKLGNAPNSCLAAMFRRNEAMHCF